jgi:hypothetical protein
MATDNVKKAAQDVRDRVAVERMIAIEQDNQREELEIIAAQTTKEVQQDISAYEQTLVALKDLASKVRGFNSDVVDNWKAASAGAALEADELDSTLQSMPDAEPRVRAILAGGVLATAEPGNLFPDIPPDADVSEPQERLGRDVHPSADSEATPWPMPCAVHTSAERDALLYRDSITPRAPSCPPLRPHSRPRSTRTAPSPLLVRPLVDLRQQVGPQTARVGTAPARVPNKGASRPGTGRLSAIRQIRRTGPVVTR